MARIAFLIPDLGGGGAERVAVTLIQGFVERGHDVDLLLLRKSGQFLDDLPAAVRVVDLKAKRARHAIAPLWHYLRWARPDALQISMWSLTVLGILVGRLALGRKMRIVTSDHASLSRQFAASPRALRAIRWSVRLFYPLADARICVSDGTAADLARLSGLARGAFTVVHNPIPGPPDDLVVPSGISGLWGEAEGRILAVGSLKSEKNYPLLIRAFAALARKRPARLVILGEGELRGTIERCIHEEKMEGKVVLAGFHADPWPYYRSANLFVLSSDQEGFGNVIVEALHCGLPVVSTDCPYGPAEILRGAGVGRLVPCGDADALAKAMGEALDAPGDQDRAKARARGFYPDRAVGHYLQLLLGKDRADR